MMLQKKFSGAHGQYFLPRIGAIKGNNKMRGSPWSWRIIRKGHPIAEPRDRVLIQFSVNKTKCSSKKSGIIMQFA